MAQAIFQLKVDGMKRAKRKLERSLIALAKEAAENTLHRSCEMVKTEAVHNVVVGRPEWPPFKGEHPWPGLYETGDLSRSFKTTYLSRGRDMVGIVYSDVEYAPYHELGTHGPHAVPPRPFLWPALTDNVNRIMQIAKEEADKSLRASTR